MHRRPENLKKSRQKNSWNQIKPNFFFREIAFLAVLNFFPVQKLIFGHFWNCKKWNLVKKIFSWNWFIWFHEFFWPGLFYIFWPTVYHLIVYFWVKAICLYLSDGDEMDDDGNFKSDNDNDNDYSDPDAAPKSDSDDGDFRPKSGWKLSKKNKNMQHVY